MVYVQEELIFTLCKGFSICKSQRSLSLFSRLTLYVLVSMSTVFIFKEWHDAVQSKLEMVGCVYTVNCRKTEILFSFGKTYR